MSQFRRRQILIVATAWLAAPLAWAQLEAKVPRIGFLGPTSASAFANRIEALRASLRDLGYVEGKNIAIEFRWADGKYERLPELAAELVRLKVDVIVTAGTPGTLAAKRATSTVPIVMAVSGDAIATGLVASLARPGANITGSTFFNPELAAKRLELVKGVLPRARRVAVLMNPENPVTVPVLEAMKRTSALLKLELRPSEVRDSTEVAGVMSGMHKAHIDAIVLYEDSIFIQNAKTIADLARKQRLPTIGFGDLVQAGGLISYGVDLENFYRRAAVFVDKILKGVKPGDIPVEQSTKFELIINMKTAKALGLTIPKELLLRADEVIE